MIGHINPLMFATRFNWLIVAIAFSRSGRSYGTSSIPARGVKRPGPGGLWGPGGPRMVDGGGGSGSRRRTLESGPPRRFGST